MEKNKLMRSSTDYILCGVCGGIAEFFGWDSNRVRLFVALLVLFGGASLWMYILAALFIPKADEDDDYIY